MIQVPITRGLFAIVDDEDTDLVAPFRWRAAVTSTTTYVVTGDPRNGTSVLMHRLITACPTGMVVDHIDRNGLNNRRANLRICTHRQNIARSNTAYKQAASGFRGVYATPGNQTFVAKLTRQHLGCFTTAEDAARAYDAACAAEFGAFAFLNFPNEISTAPPRVDHRLGDIPVRGVSRFRGRFRARAVCSGKEKHLGTFDSIEEAAAARAAFLEKEIAGPMDRDACSPAALKTAGTLEKV